VNVRSGRIVGVASLLLLAATGVAQAEQVDARYGSPVFKFGSLTLPNDQPSPNADGSFTFAGNAGGESSGWELDWNLTVDYDPSINGSVTLTNFGTSAHNYVVMLDLPVSGFSPSVFGGSLTATVFDANGDSVASVAPSTDSNASPGIYQGTIDGSTVLDLFGAVSCSGSGPHCSATLTTDDGLPGPTIAGPAVNGHIGTVLMFSLSAGDRVSFNTNFTVEAASPVPLPASGWMLLAALGGMGYLVVSRRRSVTTPLSFARTLAALPG
jgi:hypothetical protein